MSAIGRRIVWWILRHSGWVLALSLLVTLPCLYWTAKLYGNLKPDIEELLPRQSRSIQDLGEIRDRLESVENLAVLVLTNDSDAGKRYVNDLAKKLETIPTNIAASIEYRIDRELKFFSERKALFLDTADLRHIRNYVGDRIDYEKSLYNPLNIFDGASLDEPKLDMQAMLLKYDGQASSFGHFPGGYYATPDGHKRVILVYLSGQQKGVGGNFKLKAEVKKCVDSLDPHAYAPDLKVLYTGGVQNTIEEYSALIEDVEVSAEIVFGVVTVALLLFFRSFFALGGLYVALFTARFWTFGMSWFTVGYLNANSAFMGSIVLGSGITFSVMLLSRYLEERRNGRVPLRAAALAMTRTARATMTAALAAGLAYGSLMLTDFEGFRQYGVIGFTGMIFCWISSIVLLPALLVRVEAWRPFVKPHAKARRQWIFDPLTHFLGRHPGKILVTSILISLVSIASFTRFDADKIIETNLANLRNKKSMTVGSGFLGKYLDEIFQRYLSPMVVLAHSRRDANEISEALKAKAKSSDLISSVSTIANFVPPDQKEKIDLLRQIEQLLPPQIFYKLSPEDQRRAKEFMNPIAMRGIKEDDLPEMVKGKFTERDGSVGKLVLVEPPLSSTNWGGRQMIEFVREIREAGDVVTARNVARDAAGKALGPVEAPVAGSMPVVSDMVEAVSRDGPKATLCAFLGVVFLIIILFRKPSIVALVLTALVLGNLWLFGFILLFGFKINFVNFIALPITFGIGVDYAVNVFHRYLTEPGHNILRVVKETGGAVGLCSFTTITGYSSLLIAGNQGFVSFGVLAVLGEVTSLVTAVLTVPAFLLVLQRRRERLAGR